MTKIPGRSFIENLTQIPEAPSWKRKLIIGLRILLVSIHRFNKDECLMMASSLAYTTIVTLVPTLTVVIALMTIASGIQTRQDEIFDEMSAFLVKNNIQFDIAPYWETLSDIINTATQIGAVGFVVFIFSATAVLRSMEKAFHNIWKIDTHRTFVNKFVFYFFLISFGPLLFAIGKSFTDKLSDLLRDPHLRSLAQTQTGDIWVAGEKGHIGKITGMDSEIQFIPKSSIDFENMLCIGFDSIETGTCKKPSIQKENFFRVRAYNTILFAVSEEGTLLISSDSGKSWKIHSFKNLVFKDFGISGKETLYLLTEDTRTLKYQLETSLEEVVRFTEKGITPVKIRFFNDKEGFILDKEGRIWKTGDGGKIWNPQSVSDKTLNDIFFLDRSRGFVVGDSGSIFRTKDGGNTWVNLNHKRYSYERVWVFTSPKKQDYDVFVLNNLGDIILSEDEGEHWKLAYKSKGGDLLDMIHLTSGTAIGRTGTGETETEELPLTETEDIESLNKDMLGIVAVGEYKKIIRIEPDERGNLVWRKYQGGSKFLSFYSFFKFLIPLLAVWIFFILLYSLVPNTKVPIHAAVYGSAFTGIVLILFFWGFVNIYLTSFTEKTMIIYKALAAIPVFLLTIYSFGTIILLGAEVTATLQFPDRYLLPKHPFEDAEEYMKYEFFHCLRFLSIVYSHQQKKGKLITFEDLKRSLSLPDKEVQLIKTSLELADLITMDEKARIAPIKLDSQVSLQELYENTIHFTLGHPPQSDPSLPKALTTLSELDNRVKNYLGNLTLADLK